MNQLADKTSAETRVSVIIVNWNGREHLEVCLNSLEQQTFRDFEVILVDNGSVDDSVAFVREKYPWVRLVSLAENTGFATGNNRGFEQADGDYIVTLNNDTKVAPDWLKQLVAVADQHPRAGMVGCRICNFADPDLIDSLGMGICSDGMTRGRFRNRRWSELEREWRPVEEILLPSACAALYKKSMLQETGFFDDDFFAYAEDTDLGLRGRLAGWDAVLATAAVVQHKYSQTSGRLSPFKVRLVERNHFWVVLKCFPLRYLWALPLTTLRRYLEQFRCVCRKQGTGAELLSAESPGKIVRALVAGTAAALSGSGNMLVKRREIMAKRKISTKAMTMLLKQYHLSFAELLDHDAARGV